MPLVRRVTGAALDVSHTTHAHRSRIPASTCTPTGSPSSSPSTRRKWPSAAGRETRAGASTGADVRSNEPPCRSRHTPDVRRTDILCSGTRRRFPASSRGCTPVCPARTAAALETPACGPGCRSIGSLPEPATRTARTNRSRRARTGTLAHRLAGCTPCTGSYRSCSVTLAAAATRALGSRILLESSPSSHCPPSSLHHARQSLILFLNPHQRNDQVSYKVARVPLTIG